MVRLFACSGAALALLVAGLVVAQDQDRRRSVDEPKPARATTPEKETPQGSLRFNLDNFIKEWDRDGDGALSKEELPSRLRYHFDRMDTNQDGKLSREELEQGVVYLQQRRRPSDVVFILIEMSDCDEGCLQEIQHVYDVLRKVDSNQDGKLEAAELKEAREELVKGRVERLIEELDANQDGKISRDEARGLVREHFDRLDANRDGFIDRQELLRASLEGTPAPAQEPAPDREEK